MAISVSNSINFPRNFNLSGHFGSLAGFANQIRYAILYVVHAYANSQFWSSDYFCFNPGSTYIHHYSHTNLQTFWFDSSANH